MDWPPTDTHARALAHLEEALRAACLTRCLADQAVGAVMAKPGADARIEALTRHIAEAESHQAARPVRLAVMTPF